MREGKKGLGILFMGSSLLQLKVYLISFSNLWPSKVPP